MRARVNFLTEKENILSKKWDKEEGEGRLEGIANTKNSIDEMNDEDKTSKENQKGDVGGRIDLGRKRE